MVSSKREYTSCEQNNVDSTEGIDSVAILDSTTLSICAACGKEGNSDEMNTHATNVRWSSIAMRRARRNTDQSIKRLAKEGWLNYMKRHYSKRLSQKSVQYAY